MKFDTSNWKQLGLIICYIEGGKPVERLHEFIPSDCITGEALCQNVMKSLSGVGLDIQLCHSQTMDGAGDMTGCRAGWSR